MTLNFPSNPTNGQTYQGYTYSSSNGYWDAPGTTVDLSSIAEDILPDADSSRSLGSTAKKWKSLHLSANTLFLGDSGSISAGAGGGIEMGSLKIGTGTAAVELTASADGKLATKGTDASGNTEAAASEAGAASSVTNMAQLVALTGMTTGQTALVTSLNRIFMYTGTGWFKIADMTNASPTDITGVESTYSLATDGTATTITAISTDPEGFPLTWSYAVTTGSLGSTATVTQGTGANTNVFTITPSTTEAHAGEFSITFSVTDGATGAVNAVSAFSLSFFSRFAWSTITSFVSTSSTWSRPGTGDGAWTHSGGFWSSSYPVGGNGHSETNRLRISYNEMFSFWFNEGENAGTIMFTVDKYSNPQVYKHTLSTPYDISTSEYSQSVNMGTGMGDANDSGVPMCWSYDGKHCVVGGYENARSFSFATAYDLSSTMTYTGTIAKINGSTSTRSARFCGTTFSIDGTEFYTIESAQSGTSTITHAYANVYTLSTPFALSSATLNTSNSVGPIASNDSVLGGKIDTCDFSGNGKDILLYTVTDPGTTSASYKFRHIRFATAFDYSSARSVVNTYTLSSANSSFSGLADSQMTGNQVYNHVGPPRVTPNGILKSGRLPTAISTYSATVT